MIQPELDGVALILHDIAGRLVRMVQRGVGDPHRHQDDREDRQLQSHRPPVRRPVPEPRANARQPRARVVQRVSERRRLGPHMLRGISAVRGMSAVAARATCS